MEDICCKLSRLAAVVVMMLVACVGSAWAATGYAGGDPWQVGDIIVCFGNGACNVLRIQSNGTPVLLDQFSDGLLGQTSGVAVNNTLHAVVTDNGGGGASNVVVYSIASLNPNNNPATAVAHTPVPPSPFSANGGTNSNNAQAVAINGAGHFFIGNAGNGGTPTPSIVELTPTGTLASPSALPTNPFPLPAGCTDTQGSMLNMDLSADGSALYLSSGGPTIQKLTLASGTCSPFANFGGNVKLYGIKDIPAGALSSVAPNCNGTTCPADETILVVAIGNTDPDNSTGETETLPDADALNICTNTAGGAPVSCALLLDTNPNPGLTAPLWQAGNQYFTLGTPILDPQLHLQTVLTAGTSGVQEPNFSETGGTVLDNAVIWTDQGKPGWSANTPFAKASFPGTYIVDSNSNLQTVTMTGISGPTRPAWNTSGNTTDGLVWGDQGAWQANHGFALGSAVGDAAGHPHTVLTAGTSGAALPTWNDGGGVTIDNAVIWTNQGPVVGYTGGHQYSLNIYIAPNGHIQQAVEPGTSGGTAPSFSVNGGRTIDGAVIWTDQGQEFWHPSFAFPLNAVIVDPAGHVQQVTTAGTSGTSQPTFNDAGSTTAEGPDTLVWTDEGVLSWQANFIYDGTTAPKTFVVDGANHVQKATTTGTSGPSQPLFNDGGLTTDGATVWTDQGQKFWYPNFAFAANSIIVDTAGHVQQVTTAGTSGPTQPTFNDSSASVTDGLQWTDEGPAVTWTANTSYAQSSIILDGAGHIQQVIVAGTSGPGPNPPNFNDNGGTTAEGPDTLVWQDRGIPGTWMASTPYALNAVINDGSGNVQQATSAGTSGAGSAPAFSQMIGNTIPDNAVVWADQGLLNGNVNFTWQPTNSYMANAQIVDPAGHVQKVSTAGTSGANPPAFNDGGTVIDGLVWLDLGPTVPWSASTSFPLGTLSVDPGSFLQKVTTAGISTTLSQPSWNETPTGMTVDGLQWTDYGHSIWTANMLYPNPGTLISDSNAHAQKVIEAGTSGATTPAFSLTGGQTIDNAVIWTESHPNWLLNHAYVVGNNDTLILDHSNHVQLVATSGTSGPTMPPFTSNKPAAGQTIDGLQWINQASPATSVVARYPVMGTTTLQALALDPLITDCTTNPCSSLPLPTPKTSNFWLADSQSANFYKLDFATGTPTTFSANANTQSGPCGTCSSVSSIQGIGLYGGEGSNQPDLTKVLSSAVSGTANNQTAFFPLPNDGVTSNTNSLTLSLYNGTTLAASLPAFAVYGSSVPEPSCFFDGTPSLPCTVTTTTGNAIVWKNDIPLPSTGLLRLNPSTQTLAYSFDVPPAFQSVNNNVFVDSSYNTTTGVGLDYPSGRYPSSTGVGTPVNANGQQPVDFGCTYQSPTPKCFKNPGTIPVKFSCNKLPPGFLLQNFGISRTTPWGPRLQIVTPATAPPAQFCTGAAPNQANATKLAGSAPNLGICSTQLPSSNGKTTYRFDSMANDWVFNWSVPSTSTRQTYHLCTYDDTHNAQDFCIDVTVASSCP